MPRSRVRRKQDSPAARVAASAARPAWDWVSGRIRRAARYRPVWKDLRGPATCVLSLLAAFPAAVLWMAFGPFVIYPPKGFIDPWFYTGYFGNFTYLLAKSGITYYVSRLGWILPGRLAFENAGAEWGSLLLGAAVVAVGAVSLYWIVRWHYGGAPAALAAVAWCTNPYVMATAGWQYPDGAVLAYAMAGLALYLRPGGNRRWNSFRAAALLVVAGATNMSGGPMILAILAVPLWRSRRSWREFLKEAASSLAGAGAAAWALARVSQAVLGSPYFLQPQIDQTLYAMHTPGYLAGMWGSGPGFLLASVRLFPPLFLLLLGPALLWRSRKAEAAAWPVYLALAVCCALYSAQEFLLHGAALRVFYHSSYMMVPVCAFGGVALGEVWTRAAAGGRRAAISAAALVVGAVSLCLAFNVWEGSPPGGRTWLWLAAMGAGTVALVLVGRRPGMALRVPTCALILVVLFLGPALDYYTFGFAWSREKFLHGSNLASSRNARDFRRLMELQTFVASNLEASRYPVFWWDSDEPSFRFFISAAALFTCGHDDVAGVLRNGNYDLKRYYFPYTRTIVHLTAHPERIAARSAEMAAHGILLGNERRATIEDDGRSFLVVTQDVLDSSRLH